MGSTGVNCLMALLVLGNFRDCKKGENLRLWRFHLKEPMLFKLVNRNAILLGQPGLGPSHHSA